MTTTTNNILIFNSSSSIFIVFFYGGATKDASEIVLTKQLLFLTWKVFSHLGI